MLKVGLKNIIRIPVTCIDHAEPKTVATMNGIVPSKAPVVGLRLSQWVEEWIEFDESCVNVPRTLVETYCLSSVNARG